MNTIPFRVLAFTLLSMLGMDSSDGQTFERIEIRSNNSDAKFFLSGSDEIFVPNGFNYIQLIQSPAGAFGESQLFQIASHNPIDVDDDFQRMAALGYNVVRIFVDLCKGVRCIADANGLSEMYLDNIAHTIRQAEAYGLYVMLTANWLPDGGDYSHPAHSICESNGQFFGGNCLTMSAKGVELYQKFFTDFITALQDRGTPMHAIWAYELRNEFFAEFDNLPFTLESGIVTAANGKSYDMSVEADKLRMAEESLLFWANETTRSIKAIDPEALVCCGFFTPNNPNVLRENDPRIVPFHVVLHNSELDFFDIHAYAGFHEFQLEVENYRIENYGAKPIVLGEYGAFLPDAPNEYIAARLSENWRKDACQAGVDGFIFWTWDRHRTNFSNPDDPWAGSDVQSFIGKTLSPWYNPNPCLSTLPATNVAQNKTSRASMEWEEFVSDNVVDGNANQTPWIAGGDPPQWVEVDLGQVYHLEEIQLVIETGSDDPFRYIHQLQVKRTANSSYQTLHTFEGDRVNFEVVSYRPEDGSLIEQVRFVRVTILEAPGWAALHEIRALVPEQREALDVPAPPIITFPRPSLDQYDGNPCSWKNDGEDLTSHLQVSPMEDFSNITFEVTNLGQNSFDLREFVEQGPVWFRVRQINEHGSSVWSVPVLLDFTTSVYLDEAPVIKVFPNPTSDVIHVEAGSKECTSVLLNSRGEVLQRQQNQREINLTDLPSGLYYLSVMVSSENRVFKVLKL